MNTIHPDPNTYVADIQALARISGAQLRQAEHAYKKAERSFDDAVTVLKTWGYTGPSPLDMILHCPACGTQHIDSVYGCDAQHCERGCANPGDCLAWTNPPHRSHLCAECGHIWRPADVPTNGVSEIRTKGKNDSQRQEDITVAAYRSAEEPAAFTEWWKREYAKDKGLFRGARAGYLRAWLAAQQDAAWRTATASPATPPSTFCGEDE